MTERQVERDRTVENEGQEEVSRDSDLLKELMGGLSLAEILERDGVPFWADGRKFIVRPPTPEEYDYAEMLERAAYTRAFNSPILEPMKEEPPSEADRQLWEARIRMAEERFDATDDQYQKRAYAELIASLRRQMEDRTRAHELAEEFARQQRDRWLLLRLLCDENGEQLFDPEDPEDVKRWQRVAVRFLQEARYALWEVLGAVRNAPFELVRSRGSKSD